MNLIVVFKVRTHSIQYSVSFSCVIIPGLRTFTKIHVHPCEKVIGLFFRIKFEPDGKISIDCVRFVLTDPMAKLNSAKYLSTVISRS